MDLVHWRALMYSSNCLALLLTHTGLVFPVQYKHHPPDLPSAAAVCVKGEAAAELLNKSRSQAMYLYDIGNEAAGDRAVSCGEK